MDKSNEQAACNSDQQEDPVDNIDEEAAVKVKFTSISLDGLDGCDVQNGEVNVDIQVAQSTVGLGKEELMKFLTDPFWVKIRTFLFVFFGIVWIAMLVGAVVIIVLAPRCPPAPHLDWYQKNALYEVDVETFKDSDSDGVGDFRGLSSKLNYFKNLNIGTLILSAFYKLSNQSIVDHRDVDNQLGTLMDFEELLMQMKKDDIKVIIDFNPNYSSDKHQWFQNSIQGTAPYKDFYIWANASNGNSPNSWKTINHEEAWIWNEERQQYYLATYSKENPDYNLRNKVVREKLKDTLRFLLEKGVDGFRVLGAPHLLVKDPIGVKNMSGYKEENLQKMYTIDQSEYLTIFSEWRVILNNFTASSGSHKVLLANVPELLGSNAAQSGNETFSVVELPITTHLTKINEKSTGLEFERQLNMPESNWPAILLGSQTTKRLASRVGDLLDGILMVTFLAKGTPITYYGDELGLTDISSNDKFLMPWNEDPSGGFTNGTSVFHVHPDYAKLNVKTLKADTHSHLNIYKKLLALRGQPALSFGEQTYPMVTNDIFSMMRVRKGSPGYLVVLNMGSNSTTIDFTGKSEHLPEMAHVEIRSHNLKTGLLAEGDRPKIYLNNVPLEPKQSVVFSFVPLFDG